MTREELEKLLNMEVDLIPQGKRNRPGTKLDLKHITIHNTDNTSRGADARAHAKLLRITGYREDKVTKKKTWISWHFTVDGARVIRHLPLNERGMHAQNGGNAQSFGIEICMNPESESETTNLRAARLAALLMFDHKLALTAVVPHRKWYRKPCPRRLIDSIDNPGTKWDAFTELIRREFEKLDKPRLSARGKKKQLEVKSISLPDKDTNEGLLSRLLIVESRTPANAKYDAQEVLKGMKAMNAVVHNRLQKPSKFGAAGGKTVLDIVTAPGQFKGFSKDASGKLALTKPLQDLIDDVLKNANTGQPGKFHEFVANAVSVAAAAVDDPFASLTKIGNVEVKPGGFGWRTENSSEPGGFFVKITSGHSGLISGNQFYAVGKKAF